MHHAHLEKSGRLQQLLAFLRSRGELGATTAEILENCNRVKAVTAAISELRSNGFGVRCRAQGVTTDGGRVYRYWLVEPDPNALFEAEA